MRWFFKAWLKTAHQLRQPLRVLHCARQLLICDPDDATTQLDMAQAAKDAGFADLALWLLETSQAVNPEHDGLCRALAGMLEEHGDTQRALGLWESIAEQSPSDLIANRKVRDLAASETTGRFRASRTGKRSPAN